MKKKDTHLTRSLKNDRSNKDLLRTEINNATDPNVRLELTKMLVSIENKEKRKRKFVWSIVLILLMTILVFLLWLGNKSNPKDAMITTIVSNTSSEIKEPTNTTTTESIISETDLTEEQLKEWVMSILDLLPPPPTKYILNVTIDDTDNLAYIFVGIDQLDSLGSFRVNAKGELEANGPITGVMGRSNWTLMSSKYLDTSIASKYFDDRELEKIKIDDSINSTKQLLIGEKYSIAPILYDGIDATEAMNDGKAPQNLVHDGARDITFIDDSTIKVELLGTYRPDYDDTYILTENMLIIRDHYTPYTINNGTISFDTWTTDVNDHTVTWKMTQSK